MLSRFNPLFDEAEPLICKRDGVLPKERISRYHFYLQVLDFLLLWCLALDVAKHTRQYSIPNFQERYVGLGNSFRPHALH